MYPMKNKGRPRWRCTTELFLYTASYVVSPASVWKLPVFWQQNGGVAFLIPLTGCLLAVGVPLISLEISLAQFMQKGGPSAWGVVPLFKGIGVTSMLITVLKVSTNLTVAAWCTYCLYLIATNQLPTCKTGNVSPRPQSHDVGTENMSISAELEDVKLTNHSDYYIATLMSSLSPRQLRYSSLDPALDNQNTSCRELMSLYWRNTVLQMSSSLTSPGSVVIEIFISTFVVSFICYIIVVRDIRWSGKIICVLASLALAGFVSITAWTASSGRDLRSGVFSFAIPNFETLTDTDPWFSSVKVTLLTLGLGLGVHSSLASHNKLNNDVIRDAWLVTLLGVSVNIFVSVFISALAGVGMNLPDNDPSYLLTTVTASLMDFNHPVILCCLFFISVILIIISNTAVCLESVVSSLVDLSPKLKHWRLLIVTGTSALCFLIAAPMSTQGGIYVFRLFERVTAGGFILVIVCILECLIIGIVYGGSRFYDNLEMLTGKRPHWWIKFCWAYLSPVVLLASLIYQEHSHPMYELELGPDHPNFELARGLLVVLLVVLLVPILLVAVWVACSKNGTCFEKINFALKPKLKPHQVPIRWRLEGQWIKFTNRL